MSGGDDVGMIQSLYDRLLAIWPYDEQMLFAVGLYIAHFIGYWGNNGMVSFIISYSLLVTMIIS
jgi:hypothetical protein